LAVYNKRQTGVQVFLHFLHSKGNTHYEEFDGQQQFFS
jgi:hypothetical protein